MSDLVLSDLTTNNCKENRLHSHVNGMHEHARKHSREHVLHMSDVIRYIASFLPMHGQSIANMMSRSFHCMLANQLHYSIGIRVNKGFIVQTLTTTFQHTPRKQLSVKYTNE